MLVYASTKADFLDDVRSDIIDEKILASFQRHLGHSTGQSEIASWRNSMLYMSRVLADDKIPDNSGVAIEYRLPQSKKRIDFILTGKAENQSENAIIIELKQWSNVKVTSKDGVVKTFVGGGDREVTHPSYQAWTYAALLKDFNETVQDDDIGLWPCAYLHNCVSDDVINDPFYDHHTRKAPAFLRKDGQKLADFIKKYVKYGDDGGLLYRIDKGRIRPSKSLADELVSLLHGNQKFFLIDDQKIVYETALFLARAATVNEKHVLIVEGGPGTGKSVVAVNLLVALTKEGMLAEYVTKNAAPRAVYTALLTGSFKKSHIESLFKGSGVFTDTESNTFDALIVDEAHRLNEKSGMFQNLGENQIKEIINAAKCSVFFIDEDQRVTFKDIGETRVIRDWAQQMGATVHQLELQSQFRCNGSDGYLAWVDNALQIRDTANKTLEDVNYDFRVFDSPVELRDAIYEKNHIRNKARLVAGYCWDWISKTDTKLNDIIIPTHEREFSMKWNLAADSNLWIVKPDSVVEVGCIHTCQGLETDYIGVIIGPDFVVRDGVALTDATKRARTDASIKGFKALFKRDSSAAKKKAETIIKNTYRTLMTRGIKGCYIFCTDQETNEWFKGLVGRPIQEYIDSSALGSHGIGDEGEDHTNQYKGLTLRLLQTNEVEPYVNAIPVYDLNVAAGLFSETQIVPDLPQSSGVASIAQFQWVELPDSFRAKPGQFVARVVGESMNRRIPNGAWCLFSPNPGGTRQGKIVLVQHRNIDDPDTGGRYTIKRYESEKAAMEEGGWQHRRITLKPESTDPSYKPIVFDEDSAADLVVVAEMVAVLC